jgi:hypothetical protein
LSPSREHNTRARLWDFFAPEDDVRCMPL